MLDSQTILQNYSEFVTKTFPKLAHSFTLATALFENPLFRLSTISITHSDNRSVLFIRYLVLDVPHIMSIRRYGIHFMLDNTQPNGTLFTIEPNSTKQDFFDWFDSLNKPRLS